MSEKELIENGFYRYKVEISETYRKEVIVYAKNIGRAEELADQLCDSGEIDMDKNCYGGRDFSTYISYEPHDIDGPDTYIDCEGQEGETQ